MEICRTHPDETKRDRTKEHSNGKKVRGTQHEKAAIPVVPFALNDFSSSEPTEFNFVYTLDGIKYWYGFAATEN